MTITTVWTTEKAASRDDIRGLVREAWTNPGDASPEERLQQLYDSERGRQVPRVMFVEDLRVALEEGAPPETPPEPEATETELPTGQIDPSPYQPRKKFAQEELRELAQSIKENGLLQPLVVRTHPDAPGRYQLIAGERRLRAVRQLRWKKVPALIRELDDRKLLVLGLVENLQREQLSPVEEARAYQRYIEVTGERQTALAKEVGKTQGHISNRLRLLRLPEEILDLVEEGFVSSTHARDLLLPFSQMPDEYWETLVAAVEEEILKMVGLEDREGAEDSSEPHPGLTEEQLRKAIIAAGGPISWPLQSEAWLHTDHEQLQRQFPGHRVWSGTLPPDLPGRHDKECDCNAPGFSWNIGYMGGRAVRCFDAAWWEGVAAQIREERERRAQEWEKRNGSPDGEEGSEEVQERPEFEWPDRSRPVPYEVLEEVFGDVDWVEIADREILDCEKIDPDDLYWIRYEDGVGLISLDVDSARVAQDLGRSRYTEALEVAEAARLEANREALKKSKKAVEEFRAGLVLALHEPLWLRRILHEHLRASVHAPPLVELHGFEKVTEWVKTLEPDWKHLEEAVRILGVRILSGEYQPPDSNYGFHHDVLAARVREEQQELTREQLRTLIPDPVTEDTEEG